MQAIIGWSVDNDLGCTLTIAVVIYMEVLSTHLPVVKATTNSEWLDLQRAI